MLGGKLEQPRGERGTRTSRLILQESRAERVWHAFDARSRYDSMIGNSAAICVAVWAMACIAVTLILRSKGFRLPVSPVLLPLLLFVLVPPVMIVMLLFMVLVYPILAIRYSLGLDRAARSATHATYDENGVTVCRADSSQQRTLAWADIRECQEVFSGPYWVYRLNLASGERVPVDWLDGAVVEEMGRRGVRLVSERRPSK